LSAMDPELLDLALSMTTIYFAVLQKTEKNYLLLHRNISRTLPFTLFYMYICIYINLGTDSIFNCKIYHDSSVLNVTINMSIHYYPSLPLFQVSTRRPRAACQLLVNIRDAHQAVVRLHVQATNTEERRMLQASLFLARASYRSSS
jgi:hypothetical protein